MKKLGTWLQTNTASIVFLFVFFPVGLFLLWKYGQQNKIGKSISTLITLAYHALVLLIFSASISNYNDLVADYNNLTQDYNTLHDTATNTEQEYTAYQEKMKPYESLSDADAKKRQNDANAADKVTTTIQALPSVEEVTTKDKNAVASAEKLYDALTKEQKSFVDATPITELNEQIKQLEADEKAAAEKKAKEEKKKAEEKRKKEEAEKKRKEEEARGYETGTTYDQLARTPDDYTFTKVKFYGKVIQVLEDDDTTQIRLAVDDNYDTVIYGEYDSNIVSSRILEDDYITVSGISMGLLTYESTMGGNITIPSMTIDKIDQ